MAAAVPALMEIEGLVEAFLLRLPPDDPESLVRASLVCKLWRRILVDRGFRRRFCQLHRRPPILGLLFRQRKGAQFCFRPTSSFEPRNADLRGWDVIDSRHSRVLLARSRSFWFSQCSESNGNLAVWNPISGDWLELPKLPAPQDINSIWNQWTAAVLCASNPSSACDSIDCNHRHFLVVLMATLQHRAYVSVYSSQTGSWIKQTSAALDPPGSIKCLYPIGFGALAGNVLSFIVSWDLSSAILKYALGTQEISYVNLPPDLHDCPTLLTTTEFGGLGIARVESSRLHLWSWEADPGGHLRWALSRVIELNTMFPANSHSIRVLAFLHGLGAFLVSTKDGVFSIDLQSNRAKKVCEGSFSVKVVPYMCFYTPAPQVAPTNTGEGLGASVPVHEDFKFVV